MDLMTAIKRKQGINKSSGSSYDALLGKRISVTKYEYEVEKVPYIKRNSGGALTVSGSKTRDEIVGGTIAWNQLVLSGDFQDTQGWTATNGTIEASNNEGIVTPDGTKAGTLAYGLRSEITFIASHKYFVTCTIKSTQRDKFRGRFGNVVFWTGTIDANNWVVCSAVITNASANADSKTLAFYANDDKLYSTSDHLYFKNAMVIDLTSAFGSAVADHIYSLEQSNAGSGLAKLRTWGFLDKEYYANDNGSIQSVNAIARKTYDTNSAVVGNYGLADIELRGLLKLDGNNDLYYDGDTYEADGTVTRKYGIVDLGSLTWAYDSSTQRFFAAEPLHKKTNRLTPMICPMFTSKEKGETFDANWNMVIYSGGDNIAIHDHSYTDAIAFTQMLSDNNAQLVFELATQSTEIKAAFTDPQSIDPEGTEEYIDGKMQNGYREFAMPVGHNTQYQIALN